MSVAATSPTTTVTSAASATDATAKAVTVDYNAFLQLLVEQLKNQDPTKPTDSTEYLSQLASFSNVQETIQTNTKLDQLLTTSSLTQAENIVGKTISSADGKTTGVVNSVALAADGTTTATLASGTTLTLGNGVTISVTPTASGS